MRIGQFLIAAVPGEFTTMAGRRLRDALNSEAINNGGPSSVKTVIAGLSNGYTHYITTFEEYQVKFSELSFFKLPNQIIAILCGTDSTIRRCLDHLWTAYSFRLPGSVQEINKKHLQGLKFFDVTSLRKMYNLQKLL